MEPSHFPGTINRVINRRLYETLSLPHQLWTLWCRTHRGVIGSNPDRVLVKTNQQKLRNALLNPESQNEVPQDARVGDYSEMDDLRHLWGAWYEERTNLVITDLNIDHELFNRELGSLLNASTAVIDHDQIESPAVILESEEKGEFSVTLELDEPFDFSILVVVGEHFRNGYGVVTHIRYDDEEYYLEGGTKGISLSSSIV